MRLLTLALVFMSILISSSRSWGSPDWSQSLQELDVADYRGKLWRLDEFSDSQVLVVAFLGTECPLAKLYANRLVELEKNYREQGVSFLVVMSNRQDSIAEIAAFARRHDIGFPVLKDAGNRLADRLGAERTPEVFVYDANRELQYWGRIDDQYGIGYTKAAPENRDLENAITQIIAGQDVVLRETRSVGCIIGRQRSEREGAKVTFSEHVAPILYDRCVSCHQEGEIAPFSLVDYDEAAGWADMIAEVVREGRMPPWHASPEHGTFANDRSMSAEEKEILYAWADSGAPAGTEGQLPELPPRVVGWQLPREPDLILNVSPEPYAVPADGVVKYQYFVVDPQITEERWLEAAELLPGNHSVVHHILCFVRPKGQRTRIQAERSFLVGYVPGARLEPNPAGMAKRIPANSELIFQVHYTPIGTPQVDQSKLGLVFADPETITHEIVTTSAVQPMLRIPPYEGNHEVSAIIPERLPSSLLLAMSPHMHLRGKAFRYELVLPDGSRKILLDIPQYDFNWQTNYFLAEPLPMPEGSRIACTAAFDNSAENLNNPDPSKTVRWGDQTWDEMMIGYFHYAVPLNQVKSTQVSRGSDEISARVRIFDLLDTDGDDRVSLESVPAKIREKARELDVNQDGILTRREIQ